MNSSLPLKVKISFVFKLYHTCCCYFAAACKDPKPSRPLNQRKVVFLQGFTPLHFHSININEFLPVFLYYRGSKPGWKCNAQMQFREIHIISSICSVALSSDAYTVGDWFKTQWLGENREKSPINLTLWFNIDVFRYRNR